MKKSISKSKESLIDAEKIIRLASDVVNEKVKCIDDIQDESLRQIVLDGINYHKDNSNSLGSGLMGGLGLIGGTRFVNYAIEYASNDDLKGAASFTNGLKNIGKRVGMPSMRGGKIASTLIILSFGALAYVTGRIFIPPLNKSKKKDMLTESELILEKLSTKISNKNINNNDFLLMVKTLLVGVINNLKDDLGIV